MGANESTRQLMRVHAGVDKSVQEIKAHES